MTAPPAERAGAWVTCDLCQQPMAPGTGCDPHGYSAHAEDPPTIASPYRPGPDMADPCHDCNAPGGAYHHPGCDMERCPVCGAQAICCEHCDSLWALTAPGQLQFDQG
jgi:hypothetical protein